MGLSYPQIAFVVWIVLFFVLALLCLAGLFVLTAMAKRSIRKTSGHLDDGTAADLTLRVSLWVRLLRIVSLWGCPIFIALALFSLSVFDFIPWYAGAIIICLVLFGYWSWASNFASLFWTVFFARQEAAKKDFFESLLDGDELQLSDNIGEHVHFKAKSALKSIALRQGIPLIIGFIVIFGFSWFFSSICLTMGPTAISFKGMRALSPEPCETGLKPCLVYLNVAGNSSKAIFFVFHTDYKMKSPNIKLAPESKPSPIDFEITIPAEYIEMNLEVQRFVYVAYVSHLEPRQTYYFVAGDGQVLESYSKEHKFRTTDSSLIRRPLKIVSGGDVGLSDMSRKLLKLAASHDPDLIAIGGDIAYANGMKTCYRRWDRWLQMYTKQAITPGGHSIPLLTAIGNHEAGGFHRVADDAPFYLNYFFHQPFNTVPKAISTQEFETNRNKGQPTKHRPADIPPNTYHAHDLAGNLLVSLDSNVIATSDGAQKTFLETTLNASMHGPHRPTWRLALYHMPMYPSVRNFHGKASSKLREDWEPLFGKYHVDFGLENHDHTYKRSYPLLNGKIVPSGQGTVYLGDGAFGVVPRRPVPIHKSDYLVEALQESHFFTLTIAAHNVSVQAINSRNIVFDSQVIAKP